MSIEVDGESMIMWVSAPHEPMELVRDIINHDEFENNLFQIYSDRVTERHEDVDLLPGDTTVVLGIELDSRFYAAVGGINGSIDPELTTGVAD
ncbi:hypothetical protein [Halosegnis longus]|uniref:hypothetical protein n=1 Tax=Halosegnis longus TaxID=2216012 RepID=UPI00129D5234|nr:hypothetical protein [Halosegnis longus]